MQTIKPRRERYWHVIIVLAVILIPPLVMVPLVFLQAKQRADGELKSKLVYGRGI